MYTYNVPPVNAPGNIRFFDNHDKIVSILFVFFCGGGGRIEGQNGLLSGINLLDWNFQSLILKSFEVGIPNVISSFK